MGENKFLNFVVTESVLLLCLGLAVLLLPKISPISFGFVLCFSCLAYGGYKTINAFMTKTASKHYILTMFTGIVLTVAGILFYFAPIFNPMFIIGFIGVYFILESINYSAFLLQTNSIFSSGRFMYFLAILELLFGLFIIILLPSDALWLVGILIGINFLLSGVALTTLYYSNKYVHR